MTTFKAMLADSTESPQSYINDDSYFCSPKLDGMRLIVATHTGRVSLYNRRGMPFNQTVAPRVMQDLLELPPGLVFDGEIMKDGTYYIFDLLQTPSRNWRGEPLHKRIFVLEKIMETWRPKFCYFTPVVKTEFGKQAMYDRAVDEGREGVMFKMADGIYEPGERSPAWVKAKLWREADCIVAEVSPTGKSSVSLALVHDGEWDGKILGTMKNGAKIVDVGRCKVKERMLSVLQPGQVISVKYLYVGEGNHLYSPSMLTLRTDKYPTDCDTTQLVGVNRFLDPPAPLTIPASTDTVPTPA
jgi:ATP-dependent DNA ligase